jgi:hypothetical protein
MPTYSFLDTLRHLRRWDSWPQLNRIICDILQDLRLTTIVNHCLVAIQEGNANRGQESSLERGHRYLNWQRICFSYICGIKRKWICSEEVTIRACFPTLHTCSLTMDTKGLGRELFSLQRNQAIEQITDVCL